MVSLRFVRQAVRAAAHGVRRRGRPAASATSWTSSTGCSGLLGHPGADRRGLQRGGGRTRSRSSTSPDASSRAERGKHVGHRPHPLRGGGGAEGFEDMRRRVPDTAKIRRRSPAGSPGGASTTSSPRSSRRPAPRWCEPPRRPSISADGVRVPTAAVSSAGGARSVTVFSIATAFCVGPATPVHDRPHTPLPKGRARRPASSTSLAPQESSPAGAVPRGRGHISVPSSLSWSPGGEPARSSASWRSVRRTGGRRLARR